MQLENTSQSMPIAGKNQIEALNYAFQLYLMGELDEKLFLYFCLLNDKLLA